MIKLIIKWLNALKVTGIINGTRGKDKGQVKRLALNNLKAKIKGIKRTSISVLQKST